MQCRQIPEGLDCDKRAKLIIGTSIESKWGDFRTVELSSFFPPRCILNQYFAIGRDVADLDNAITWEPFTVSAATYKSLWLWWQQSGHSEAIVDPLGAHSWRQWVSRIHIRL